MTVLARTKSGVGRIRRRQGTLGAARGDVRTVAATPSTGAAADPEAANAEAANAEAANAEAANAEAANTASTASALTATAGRTNGMAASRPGRRREAGHCEDEAVYSCKCGFVFRAPVSTSVDCPHCGSSQAW